MSVSPQAFLDQLYSTMAMPKDLYPPLVQKRKLIHPSFKNLVAEV
jgi:hypothetical protein